MKLVSIFHVQEALYIRLVKWTDPSSQEEIRRFYELRDRVRQLNPQMALVEPLSLVKWLVRKMLAIVGLIGIAWFLAALSSQGLGEWNIHAVASAFTRYVQETGAAGVQSDLTNVIAIVISIEVLIAMLAPGWFFNWRNPIDEMVSKRLLQQDMTGSGQK